MIEGASARVAAARAARDSRDRDAEALAQILPRDRRRRHSHHRLARGGPAAAAVVAEAVLLLVGVVSVSGPKAILDLLVVARALIFVLDQQTDRRAGRAAFEHARQDAHLIRLLALAGVARRAGAPAFEVRLDVLLRQLHARRTAVDDAAKRRPVAFAEGRDREQSAEGVAGHV